MILDSEEQWPEWQDEREPLPRTKTQAKPLSKSKGKPPKAVYEAEALTVVNAFAFEKGPEWSEVDDLGREIPWRDPPPRTVRVEERGSAPSSSTAVWSLLEEDGWPEADPEEPPQPHTAKRKRYRVKTHRGSTTRSK